MNIEYHVTSYSPFHKERYCNNNQFKMCIIQLVSCHISNQQWARWNNKFIKWPSWVALAFLSNFSTINSAWALYTIIMLFQILPGNLALPLVFVFKFILFIAFPLGTLAKEIRGKLSSTLIQRYNMFKSSQYRPNWSLWC